MDDPEPRLPFDHCLVEAKSDLDAIRVRPRGPGPPKQGVLEKESGRPRQLAAELSYLAARGGGGLQWVTLATPPLFSSLS